MVILFLSFLRLKKIFEEEESEKLIPYIGVLAATIFAFQFVNYPVPGGTSGHLVGGTLVGVILGPWAAVVVLFMVIVVQSLFGDGGITAIGPNTFNMGVIAGIGGFYIVKIIMMILNRTSMKNEIKLTVANVVPQVGIGIGGAIPMNIIIPAMVFWHLIIGIGEAIISALIVWFIFKAKPEIIITQEKLGIKAEERDVEGT